MKSRPNVKDLIASKNWKFLIKNTLPVNITDTCSFPEAMHIADHLFNASVDEMTKDGFTADLMRDYSVNLMKILRAKYPNDWRQDWKNEAYLGISCALVFREEEAFVHIEKAYKQLEDPPQSLILAYISAGTGSDHFLTTEQVAELSQNAIEKGITYESALHMASLAYDQRDFKQQKYWELEASHAKEKEIHTPTIIPNVLKDVFKVEKGRHYEE